MFFIAPNTTFFYFASRKDGLRPFSFAYSLRPNKCTPAYTHVYTQYFCDYRVFCVIIYFCDFSAFCEILSLPADNKDVDEQDHVHHQRVEDGGNCHDIIIEDKGA